MSACQLEGLGLRGSRIVFRSSVDRPEIFKGRVEGDCALRGQDPDTRLDGMAGMLLDRVRCSGQQHVGVVDVSDQG